MPNGHVIFLHAETYAPYNNGFYFSVRTNSVGQSNVGIANAEITPNTWNAFSKVTRTTNTFTDFAFYWSMNTNYAVGDSVKLRNVYIVDLTLMFGAGNEPSTVEEFESMFPASYYPYNEGTLLSAGVTEVVSKGKNIFNKNAQTEVKNAYRYYPVPIGATQTLHMTFADKDTSVSLSGINIGFVKGNSGVATDYRWIIQNGVVQQVNTNIINNKLLDYVFIYPNTQEAFDKLTSRYDICVSLENSYSPYMSATYSIPAEVQALEGYGWSAGTPYNYIDYERKVYVQNVGAVDLGSLTWNVSGAGNMFTIISDMKAPASITEVILINPKYPHASVTSGNMTYWINTNTQTLYIRDESYVTANDFKSAMSGVYAYYQLATPIETDISQYLTDNLIEVGAGGTLTFPNSNGNDYHIPVPSTETYMIDLQEAIENGN